MNSYAFASRPDAASTIDYSPSSSRGPDTAGVAGRWATACLLGLLAAAATLAAPGELDPTFDDGGRARISILDEFGYELYLQVNAIAQQDDGKLLLAGSINGPNDDGNYSENLLVMRLNADGSLDTSFDGDGWVSIDVVPSEFSGSTDYAYAIVVQPDDKIAVAGETIDYQSTGEADMVLARLNADGSRDTTFGTNGVVVRDTGGFYVDRATGIVAQSNGSLVVAGDTDRNGDQDVIFARFDTNGALDTTFGTDGETVVFFGPFSTESVAGLTQDSTGALVAVGQGPGGSGQQTLVAYRLTADGDLDAGFGTDGLAVVNFGNQYTEAFAIALRSDDKVALLGRTWSGSYVPALALLNTDGSLDTGFDGDGTITPDLNPDATYDNAYGIVVEPDNKIVIAGGFQPDDYTFANDMFLARLNADGSTDTSFGDGGIAIADFGESGYVSQAEAKTLLRQADGRLVVAGGFPGGGGWTEGLMARFDSAGGMGSGGVLSFKQLTSYWDENAGTIMIPVRRTGGATGPVSVQVRVGWNAEFYSPIGAGEGCDYQDVTALLEWADGDYADKQVSITLLDDDYQENADRFTIELYSPAGADTAQDNHHVEINYDPADTTFPDPGTVSIELEKTVGEGDGAVTLIVSRTGAAQDCEVVGVTTYFGYGGYEATPGLDYTALSTIVQFGDGDTANKQVTVPIIDDALGERDETFARATRRLAGWRAMTSTRR